MASILKKGGPSAIHRQEALKLITKAYRHTNGYGLSKTARSEEGWEETKALTYGEVLPKTFIQILAICRRACGGEFVDLGSGTGLAVATAAVSGLFEKCKGIELVSELHECAIQTRDSLVNALHNHELSEPVKTSNKSKRDLSQASEQELSTFLLLIDELLVDPTPLDEISRQVVATKGAKFYRRALKGSGNLRKLLRRRPERYLVDETRTDGVVIVSKLGSDLPNRPSQEIEDCDAPPMKFPEISSDVAQQLSSQLSTMEFVCGDIFRVPWIPSQDSPPMVIYAASLLFDETMMDKLSTLVETLPPGSIFVSLKPLRQSSDYQLFHKDLFSMSWKMPSDVFFYELLPVNS